MGKGDDYIQKKKSKAIRKRMRRAGADSLEAIQGVQASKRRRKAGMRRACEGMCYTLPTADDPFNDRSDRRWRRKANRELRKRKVTSGEILQFETNVDDAVVSNVNHGYGKPEQDALQNNQTKRQVEKELVEEHTCLVRQGTQRSYLKSEEGQMPNDKASSLSQEIGVADNAVLDALRQAGLLNGPSANLVSCNSKTATTQQGTALGKQCRRALTKGVDVVAVSSLGWQERALAYVVLAAAHIKSRRLKYATLSKPLVVIIVATQERALQVRRVCKAMRKPLGISSVSLHTGTSLERQIEGLSAQTPEIVVATPERLTDVLALKLISFSRTSLLVIDGLDEFISKCLESYVSKVMDYVHKGARKLIISKSFSKNAVNITRQVIVDPITRVTCEPNLDARSACITQSVSVFTSADKRLPKLLRILQQVWENQERRMRWNILLLVENAEAVENLLPAVRGLGYSVAGLSSLHDTKLELVIQHFRDGSLQTLLATEGVLEQIPLERVQIVINHSFPSTIMIYQQILNGMARHTVNGVLHSFCTATMASLACDLVQVMESCSQEVPRTLQMLADAASLCENGK